MGAEGLLGQEGGAGVYRAREVSLQISTDRSRLSGVSSQPRKGLQQAAEVKHLPTVSGVTCQTPRDVPSIPKSRCKPNTSLRAEVSPWSPSEQNQLGAWLCPWPQLSVWLAGSWWDWQLLEFFPILSTGLVP